MPSAISVRVAAIQLESGQSSASRLAFGCLAFTPVQGLPLLQWFHFECAAHYFEPGIGAFMLPQDIDVQGSGRVLSDIDIAPL
jgi:hypothetical protein